MYTFVLCLCLVDRYEVCGISLNRPAYQSSVHLYDGFQHTANLAIDGYRDLTKCAITNIESKPWWIVDLGATMTVINVTVTNGIPVLFTGKNVRRTFYGLDLTFFLHVFFSFFMVL